jgi:splicing factor 3A subunit 3
MSTSIFEQLRSSHEMAEVLEASIGVELDRRPVGQKDKIGQQHIISRRVDGIIQANEELSALYSDADNLLKDEIENMVAPRTATTSIESFYSALNTKIAHHERFPSVLAPAAPTAESIITNVDDIHFTGAEVWGRYVDLTELHAVYTNLMRSQEHAVTDSSSSSSSTGAQQQKDYLQYMESVLDFQCIPHSVKSHRGSREYEAYLEGLCSYLTDYLQRTQPLLDMHELAAEWEQSWPDLWKEHPYRSYSSSTRQGKTAANVRPDDYNSVSDLLEVGDDMIKSALSHRGLKTGGTSLDRATRLYAVKGLNPDQYPAKFVAKGKKPTSASIAEKDVQDVQPPNSTHRKESMDRWERIAYQEYIACNLGDIVTSEVLGASRTHAEKQLTRSIEERMQELKEEELGLLPDIIDKEHDENGDDDDDDTYNPKNLPLGWDGKPIPFWMYKLHGLKSEYKCEICGDEVYRGRRAFDRHFHEARHAHGMRVLGIPNTRHFVDVVSIDDAVKLWTKIQADEAQILAITTGAGVEYEDAEGNVWRK